MKYTTAANRRNKIATVHSSDCGTLKEGQDAPEVNAIRRSFDDGLLALEFAQAEMPDSYGFCAICLKGRNSLVKAVR
jgi:hypothetical protein